MTPTLPETLLIIAAVAILASGAVVRIYVKWEQEREQFGCGLEPDRRREWDGKDAA